MNSWKFCLFLFANGKGVFIRDQILYRNVFVERFFVNEKEKMIAIYFGKLYCTGFHQTLQNLRQFDRIGLFEDISDEVLLFNIYSSNLDCMLAGLLKANESNQL